MIYMRICIRGQDHLLWSPFMQQPLNSFGKRKSKVTWFSKGQIHWLHGLCKCVQALTYWFIREVIISTIQYQTGSRHYVRQQLLSNLWSCGEFKFSIFRPSRVVRHQLNRQRALSVMSEPGFCWMGYEPDIYVNQIIVYLYLFMYLNDNF